MIGIRIFWVERKGTVISEGPPEFYIRHLCAGNPSQEIRELRVTMILQSVPLKPKLSTLSPTTKILFS